MTNNTKYRLVTRDDFDGLVCAVLLKDLGQVDELIFVHPQDMQNGKVPISSQDIIANLPFVAECHMSFDHHYSELIRLGDSPPSNCIIDAKAPSAARVIYNHYEKEHTFPQHWESMMVAVDKCDSAQLNQNEILKPKGWVLLNYLMDPRTGLGRFKNFRISNYQLMLNLIGYFEEYDIDEILNLPDVMERIERYYEHSEKSKEQICRCTKIQNNLGVLDLRDEEIIYSANRFMIYALYPEINISIHVLKNTKDQKIAFSIGNSILNRSSKTNIGALALVYGGGGHANAGGCQIEIEKSEQTLSALMQQIITNG